MDGSTVGVVSFAGSEAFGGATGGGCAAEASIENNPRRGFG